jgi:hypothetical protein
MHGFNGNNLQHCSMMSTRNDSPSSDGLKHFLVCYCMVKQLVRVVIHPHVLYFYIDPLHIFMHIHI